ncbi:MAG TPA: hypothetical protein ENJ32_12705 [Crenotrichaceae bacterium]|nr:hypothetical protein [Crenotrichaceae bacterium]
MRFLHQLILALIGTCLLLKIGTAAEKEAPQFIEGTVRVSAEEIVELVEMHDDLVLINSRNNTEKKAPYIEGSVNLSPKDTYSASLARFIHDKTTPVVFYCKDISHDCSAKAAKIAAAEGYLNIYWFRGGIQEWQKKGYPVVQP